MTSRNTPRPHRPRWLALSGLGAAVLGAHLLLLTGGLPSFAPAVPAPAVMTAPQAVPVQARTLPAEASEPLPASLSTVRWLAPPAPAPVAAAAPPKPKPRVKAAPQAQPPEPQPEPAQPPPTPAETPLPTDLTALNQGGTPDAPAAPTELSTGLSQAAAPIDTPKAPEPSATPGNVPAADTQPSPAEDTDVAAARRSQAGGKADDSRLPPAQPPASAQLNYTVEGKAKGLQYSASGVLDWARSDSAYSARMEIRVFLLGSRVQTSQGAVVATGLQPERFGDKSRSERAAHFDRGLGRIRFSNNAPDAELLPGAQDRLSVFFQLAGLLNARPEAHAAGQSVAVPVAGTGSSEVWRFEMQGLESLNLPAGELVARHLVRQPRQAYDTRVDIWLAPSLGHLPVRIRITQDNGDVVDQKLSALP